MDSSRMEKLSTHRKFKQGHALPLGYLLTKFLMYCHSFGNYSSQLESLCDIGMHIFQNQSLSVVNEFCRESLDCKDVLPPHT